VTTAELAAARAEIEALADHYATTHHSPALAWGVMLDGRLALSGASGGLDGGQPPTAATVFRIASMTKSFTAAAVLRLRDDGVLALDDPVPELAALRPTPDSPAITLRHLLSMQAGLTSDDRWADRHLDIGAGEFDALLANGPLFAISPGTGFEYSNLSYGVIGRAIHRITGERPQDVVDRLVIDPLGLDRTTWTQPEHDDWARPYRVVDGQPIADDPPIGDGWLAPMGGLWSTVDDVARVMAFFDDAFPARDGGDDGPLCRASRREQQQVHRVTGVVRTEARGEGVAHVPERIDAVGYGFGMQVIHDLRFGHIAAHSGGLPGYGSNMRWLPGRRVGAVALANSTYTPMRELTRRMLEVLDDRGLVPRVIVPLNPVLERAAGELLALINDWSDAAADALFADNVAPDESYERLARQAAGLVEAHGALTMQRLEAALATDATIIASAADGREVKVWFALGPARPGRIQEYEITPEPPAGPR
jgi:CubicO group peptidase (beta-lactamase class C family)